MSDRGCPTCGKPLDENHGKDDGCTSDECPRCGFLHAQDRSCEDRSPGLARHATGRPRTVDHAEARRLRATGLSYPEVAAVLGCHHTTVMYACNPAYRKRKNKAARDDSRWRRGMAG